MIGRLLLYEVVKEGLFGKVAFEQKWEEMRELCEYLREEHVWQ